MLRILLLTAVSLLVMGCAETTPMQLGPDHPASPSAAEAPTPEPSPTLAINESALATTSPGTGPAGMDHAHPLTDAPQGNPNHLQHDMGGMTMPAVPSTRSGTPASEPTTKQTVYTCPMHPEVVSDKPGKCPKCGMTLVKKGEG
jgi:hypothetical protein